MLSFFSSYPTIPVVHTLPYTTLFRSIIFIISQKVSNTRLLVMSMSTTKSIFCYFFMSHSFNYIWTSHKRSEEHTSELQSLTNLVCRLLLEKKKELWQDASRTCRL